MRGNPQVVTVGLPAMSPTSQRWIAWLEQTTQRRCGSYTQKLWMRLKGKAAYLPG
jgi:hypothetical protein